MALRVLHQRGGTVEAHGLIVEQGGGEGGQVMALEVGAGVGQQGEAGGVGFRKAIEREGGDGLHDLLLGLGSDAVAGHAGAQLGFDLAHARLRALEAHGAAQFLGLTAAEAGSDHGHAQ